MMDGLGGEPPPRGSIMGFFTNASPARLGESLHVIRIAAVLVAVVPNRCTEIIDADPRINNAVTILEVEEKRLVDCGDVLAQSAVIVGPEPIPLLTHMAHLLKDCINLAELLIPPLL